MKKLSVLLVCVYFLFSGCTSKDAINHFNHSNMYGNALQVTKSVQIKSPNEVQAIINATYLNPVDEQFESKDLHNFLVGVYIIEGFVPVYEFSLNGQKPVKIGNFTKDHLLYDQLPLHNKWAQYKVVSFKKQKDVIKLDLKINHLTLGSAKLEFEAN